MLMAPTSVTFQHETHPENYALAFEPFLYNQEAYLQLKEGKRYSFYAVDDIQQRVLARIHFLLVPDETGTRRAVSLPQSPFGSVEYGTSFDEATLLAFMAYVIKELQMLPVSAIEVRDCITAYRAEGCILLEPVLRKVGFEKSEVVVNHHILVDQKEFADKIHSMEKRRLRKCQRRGLNARQEPLAAIEFFYEFILNCRQERGWQLSMSKEEVCQAVTHLPSAYRIFAVYDQQTCIAASLVVQVHASAIYNFLPASLRAYHSYSPMVALIAAIYDNCYTRSVKVLDLGTSREQSLQTFKAHVGGTDVEKNTFVLDVRPGKDES